MQGSIVRRSGTKPIVGGWSIGRNSSDSNTMLLVAETLCVLDKMLLFLLDAAWVFCVVVRLLFLGWCGSFGLFFGVRVTTL